MSDFHLDYCFPGDGEGTKPLTVLVARERLTRMTMSSLVSRKGADKAVAARVRSFIVEVGCEHADIILKSGQEESIKALLREVGKQHAVGGGKVLPEDSPVGSSDSNGVAERAVQSVEGQIRVLRAALEER